VTKLTPMVTVPEFLGLEGPHLRVQIVTQCCKTMSRVIFLEIIFCCVNTNQIYCDYLFTNSSRTNKKPSVLKT
jgi:hypothetical protein